MHGWRGGRRQWPRASRAGAAPLAYSNARKSFWDCVLALHRTVQNWTDNIFESAFGFGIVMSQDEFTDETGLSSYDVDFFSAPYPAATSPLHSRQGSGFGIVSWGLRVWDLLTHVRTRRLAHACPRTSILHTHMPV